MERASILGSNLKETVKNVSDRIPLGTSMDDLVAMKRAANVRCTNAYAPNLPADFCVPLVGLLAVLCRIKQKVHDGEQIQHDARIPTFSRAKCVICLGRCNGNQMVQNTCRHNHYFHVTCIQPQIQNGVFLCPGLSCRGRIRDTWTGADVLEIVGDPNMVSMINDRFREVYEYQNGS